MSELAWHPQIKLYMTVGAAKPWYGGFHAFSTLHQLTVPETQGPSASVAGPRA